MKQKKDWTDGLRDRMKGAQMTPPDGGWARLEKELGGTGGHSPVSVPWKRVAVWTAAAAAVLAVVFFAIPDSEQASPLTSSQSPLLQEGTGEATDEGLQIPLLDAAGLQIRPNVVAQNMTSAIREVSTQPEASPQPSPKGKGAASGGEASPQPSPKGKGAASGSNQSPLLQEGSGEAFLQEGSGEAILHAPTGEAFRSRGRITLGIPGGGAGGGTTSVMPGALALMNGNYYYSSRPMAVPPAKGPSFASNPYATIGNYVFNHRPELSVGLSISYEPIERLVLETGLVWTTLSSQVITPANTREQRVQYLGLPLYAGWRFAGRGALSLTLSAGTTVERCLGARLGTWRQDERPWQFAVGGQMTVGYDLGHHVSLAFQPGLSYHLTETRLTTSRTGHPWAPSLRLTLQYTL